MKKLMLLVLVGAFLFSAEALAKRPPSRRAEIKRDTVVTFVGLQELRLVNPKPIEIGYRKWAYGNVCTSQTGAEMQVLGVKGGKVLLLYVPALEESTIACPPGVLFLLPTREFLRLKALGEKRKAAEQAERELVQQILSER